MKKYDVTYFEFPSHRIYHMTVEADSPKIAKHICSSLIATDKKQYHTHMKAKLVK